MNNDFLQEYYKSKISNQKSEIKHSFALAAGFMSCLLIVYFAHAHLVPPPDQANFNPAETCLAPPTGCWDAYSKPFYQCVEYDKDTVIRSGITFEKGFKNCYKSLYWNLDSTSFYIVAWFVLWAIITERGIEMMVIALLNDNLRLNISASLVLSIPSCWYVTSVMIHYLNDRYYPFYNSQLYFTLSELFCQIVAIVHIPANGKTYPFLLTLMAGTALSHIAQLVMDEPWIVTGSVGTTFRNFALLSGDIALFFSAWSIMGGRRKANLFNILGVCVIKLITFQLFFADKASFSLFLI